MFYRYATEGGGRIPVDFDNMYRGACFLAGGAPSLADEDLSLLRKPGINLMAMNNTASLFQDCVDFWIGGDKPKCYSERILKDPGMLKFAVISRRDIAVNGSIWKHMPSTFFFGTSDKFNVKNFLMPHRDFVWWKNTFYIALQILHRLGFRKVYLIGCSFQMKKEKQYSYDVNLTDQEQNWNKRVYGNTVDKMKGLKPTFDEAGFEIISATPDSLLNDIYPTMTFNEAIEDALKDFPEDYHLDECVHSSFFKNKEQKNGQG